MVEEGQGDPLTADKIRERRWVWIAVLFALFLGACGATYSFWSDGDGHTRFRAELAVFVVLGILCPIWTALMLRGAHTRPLRKRPKRKGVSSWTMFGVFVLAPLLQANPKWEPVFFAAAAAFAFGAIICFGSLFLVVSPEEELTRRQAAELV